MPLDSLLVSDPCRARGADEDLDFGSMESFAIASRLTPRAVGDGEPVVERLAEDASLWNRPRCRPGRCSGDVSEIARLSSLWGSAMAEADAWWG